ncbi:unnamed protein product [Arabidopsis lyrata]|nr:unnamed protein product [Arabidopsis lyrata]
MDLYEAEYNEDFMKSIIHGGGGGANKNLGDTQVVPQSHVVPPHETDMLESNRHVDGSTLIETLKASSSKRMMIDYDNRMKIKFIPPDEQSVVAERMVESGFNTSSAGFTEDSEGSMYLSSMTSQMMRGHKFLQEQEKLWSKNAEAYNSPERKQRRDINKKMRTLQDLLPNSHKDDNESVLDEAINYMKNLQLQVQMMTMGNTFVTPSMMLPFMGMQMGAQQFLPAHVLGAGLPGINDSADMLRFLNHPGLIQMQKSAPFTPTEDCSPQSVPPSCAAFPNHIPNSTSLSNLDGASPYTRNQGTLTDEGILPGKNLETREQMK